METIRTPFQGVTNIVRFNWHFYLLSVLFLALLYITNVLLNAQYSIIFYIVLSGMLGVITTSLTISYYVYDVSDLYTLNWLDNLTPPELSSLTNPQIVNIHAGFDETSALLQAKYPNADLKVFDFYNPKKHTEISIKRARASYPPYPNTVKLSTFNTELPNNSIDLIFVMFSAHEIRDTAERVLFFKEMNRIIKPSGTIIITEHLQDIPNFLAYNIGFFHFWPKGEWLNAFKLANLDVNKSIKITPFISSFILGKNDKSY